jgi:chromate transporter
MSSSAPADGPAQIRARDIFMAFLSIAVAGVGGVLPHAQHQLVERRRWLTQREFAELLSAGQLLPGPNIVNVSIMVGARHCGLVGAIAGVAGMMLVPFFFVITLAAFYRNFGNEPNVRQAFNGIAAGAAGLMIATGIKLAKAQPRKAWALGLTGTAFVLIGLARLPLIPVLLSMAPVAIWLASRDPGTGGKGQ